MRVPSWLHKLELVIGVVLGVGATLIMFMNAALRYLFNDSIIWGEEAVRIMFVAAMFLAITMSFARDEHVGFDALAKQSRLGDLIRTVGFAVSLIAVGAITAWYGWIYNGLTGSTPLPSTDLPTGVLLVPGVLAGALWVPIGIYHLITGLRRTLGPAPDAGNRS